MLNCMPIFSTHEPTLTRNSTNIRCFFLYHSFFKSRERPSISLIRRWFEIRRDGNYLGYCLRLLAGLHKHDGLLIDMQLLQSFRAAEAYHKHKIGKKPSKPSKHSLELLIRDSGDIGEQIMSACENFVGFAARHRGAVGHTDDAFIGNLGKGFMAVSRGMCWMLRRIYLVELGVPKAEADQIIQAHQRYKYDLTFIQESTS